VLLFGNKIDSKTKMFPGRKTNVMLSGQILAQMGLLIQINVLPEIPKLWHKQLLFGYKAISLKPISSLNANARSVIAVRNTAESTMTRTLHNEGLPAVLAVTAAKLAAGSGLVTPDSLVNCDHSDFDGLVAFVCAVQTGKGRAVPMYTNVGYSGKLPAHDEAPARKRAMRVRYNQQDLSLYEQTMVDLEALAAHLGFWPRLVFDRGFGGEPLVRGLMEHGAIFYVRMKAGRLVEASGGKLKVSQLTSNDSVISLEGITLRIVRSDDPETGEPWYILTPDMTTSREKIIRIYYYRFEIEESFKDVKHIRDLHKLQVDLALSLKVVLWFVILGILLLYLSSLKTMGQCWFEERTGHPKKRLSWYRWLHELLEWLIWQPLFEAAVGGR
jgi:hypothetical protein